MNDDQQKRIKFSLFEVSFSIKDFILVTVVPFIIILLSLLTKSFWGDEVFSINFATVKIQSLINTLASDYHPPLYFLILKCWINLFGISEVAIRVFQAIQGVIFFIATLLLFRRFFPNNRYHPFWWLLIFSSELWLFMPMIRYYTLAAILSIFSTLIFFEWLETNNRKSSILLCLSYILLLYTDYPVSIIIVYHFIYIVVKNRKLLIKLFLIDIVAIIFFTPWIFITLQQVQKLFKSSQIADFNLSFKAIPLKFAYSFYAFIFGETIYPYEPIAIIVALLILGTLIISFSRIKNIITTTITLYSFWLVIIGILFTSIVTTFISKHTSFIYTPSRTLFALPFLFLLFGAIYSILDKTITKNILIGVFLLINIYGVSNWIMNRHFIMPVYATPWKEVMDTLKGESGIILVDESLCYEYYSSVRDGVYPEIKKFDSVQDIRSFTNQPRYIFLILTGRESTEFEIKKEIIDYIQTNGKKIYERKFLLLDDSYRKFKSKILRRDTYDAKLTLYKYELQPSL